MKRRRWLVVGLALLGAACVDTTGVVLVCVVNGGSLPADTVPCTALDSLALSLP